MLFNLLYIILTQHNPTSPLAPCKFPEHLQINPKSTRNFIKVVGSTAGRGLLNVQTNGNVMIILEPDNQPKDASLNTDPTAHGAFTAST